MIVEHEGRRPKIHDSAVVAQGATVCGDVTIGENTAVMYGAVIVAQGGPVVIGDNCIVLENAVIRGTRHHPTRVGNNCLVGPNGYLTGCVVEDDVFLATGCAIFNGATLGARSEVRIHGVVHVNSRLAEDSTVPIGWIAVGDPAEIRPPNEHDEIWAMQQTLNFPGTVFGVERSEPGKSKMPEVARRYCQALRAHKDDVLLD